MGGRFSVVLGALAALGLVAACGGQSIRRSGGDSGEGGEGNAGTGGSNGARDSGPKGGTTSTGGSASSNGGTGARDKPPPLVGGATGAGATSGSGNDTSGGTSPGSGGGTAAGGSGGSIPVGCADPTRIPLVPDETGWIQLGSTCDSIGVQGGWFAFADSYGDATCTLRGKHMGSECARVNTPNLHAESFPNQSGEMHTAGVAEQVLPCVAGITTAGCPDHDWANMWGAGIGFDLNHAPPSDVELVRQPWNATHVLATGIEFTLDSETLPGLRVEFPMTLTDAECDAASPPLPHGSTTDDHTAGAPYWGAQARGDGVYPPSPIVLGVNQIRWEDVQAPKLGTYTFDPSRLLGVRFHVPTSSATSAPYDFTISDVAVHRAVPLD